MNWIQDWKHKSILRGINRQKLEPGYVETSLRFQQRNQNDVMPGMTLKPRPIVFETNRWITNSYEMPKVLNHLPVSTPEQRMNRRLRLVR